MEKKSDSRRISEENAATTGEIKAAIEELTDYQLYRLGNFSKFRSLDLVGRSSKFEAEDALLTEAYISILSGKRKWKSKKKDIYKFLIETMRSIADHERKHLLSNLGEIESKLNKINPKEDDFDPIENLPKNQPNPIKSLIAKEKIERIEKKFSDDPIVLNIIDGLRDGMTGPEIRGILNLSTTEYETARMKLLRGVRKLRDQGEF